MVTLIKCLKQIYKKIKNGQTIEVYKYIIKHKKHLLKGRHLHTKDTVVKIQKIEKFGGTHFLPTGLKMDRQNIIKTEEDIK